MTKTIAIALCAIMLAAVAFGQSSGTIQGVVSDNTGAVMPNAAILVRNLETGVESRTASNNVGFYTVPALNPGRYSVTCSAPGFAPKEFPSLRLEVQQTARVDCSLNVGNLVETIEVSASAQLIQSEKTEVGQVIDGKRIVEMLWEVVMADGLVHEFESNLVWRVAELLGVSTRNRVILKQGVARRAGSASTA